MTRNRRFPTLHEERHSGSLVRFGSEADLAGDLVNALSGLCTRNRSAYTIGWKELSTRLVELSRVPKQHANFRSHFRDSRIKDSWDRATATAVLGALWLAADGVATAVASADTQDTDYL